MDRHPPPQAGCRCARGSDSRRAWRARQGPFLWHAGRLHHVGRRKALDLPLSMRGGCPSRRHRRCTACAILSLAITLPDSLGSSRPGMLTGTPSGQARAIPMSPAPLEPTWLNPEGRHVGLDRLGDGYRITDEMAGPAKRRYRGSRIPGRPVSHPRERAPKPSDRHRSPERCCTRARTSPGPPPPATRDTGADDAAQPEARQPGSWDSGRMRRS